MISNLDSRADAARVVRRLAIVSLAALAVACAGSADTALDLEPAAPDTEITGDAEGAPKRLSVWTGDYDADANTLTFARRGASAGSGGLAPQAFGKRTSDDGESTEELTVTSGAFQRDEKCPNPGPNQLCVVVTIQNNRPYLVRNVYLQFTSLTPNDPARFGGKNSDVVLKAHAAAIPARDTKLGLWWFGHLPPRGSRKVQMVLNNPQANFSFEAQAWGDAAEGCTHFGRDEWPVVPTNDGEAERVRRDRNCDGINGGVGSGVFVDPARGSDTLCPENPVAGDYPNDDAQGVTGCGNGSIRRPFATLTTALAQRNGRPDVYVAGVSGRQRTTYSEPSAIVLPDGVGIFGGYDQTTGFARRARAYRARVVVGSPSGFRQGAGSEVQLVDFEDAP